MEILYFVILSFVLLFTVNFSLAQSGTGGTGASQELFEELDKAGGSSGAGLSDKDPRVIIGGVIKGFLGLLGIIFLVLMVYAGYLWMTAQGNEEQVTKAKKMITNSIIGIIIIMAAYAITQFVVNAVSTVGGG